MGKSENYMLKDILREIMIFNEGSWGHPRASPKRVKIAEKEKWQKILFFQGKIEKWDEK